MNHPKLRGTAIIVSLFIVALVAGISVTMVARLDRDIHRTELLVNSIKAHLYAKGSVLWAMDQLKNNGLRHPDHRLVDAIPSYLPPQKVDYFTIETTILDAQSRFNINNLSTPDSAPQFMKLLRAADPDLKDEKISEIAKSVMKWVGPSVSESEDDLYYSKLESSPYRAAHRPMADASELRLVRGITPSVYVKLRPYIVALPEGTPINVNTAPNPVLQSLSLSMNTESAKEIEHLRQSNPFVDVDQFISLDVVRNHSINKSKITTVSQYFLIETKVSANEQQFILYTLVQRVLQNNKPAISVIWQTKGVSC